MFYIQIFVVALAISLGVDLAKTKRVKGSFFVLLVLFLSLVGGLRDIGVGTDTVTYSESYYYAAKDIHSFMDLIDSGRDIGYVLLNLIAVYFQSLWVAHFLGQLMTHGIILYVVYLLKKRYPLIHFSLFVFVYLFIFYNQTFNFMRQYCSIALTMCTLYYMLQNKWGVSLVCMIVSFFFHPSAILFALAGVYYYMCVVSKSKLYTWLAVLGALISIFLASKFYYILSEFSEAGLVSEVYSERYGADGSFKGREGFRPTVLFMFIGMFYLIYRTYVQKVLKLPYIFFWGTLHVSYIAFSLLSLFSVFLYRLGLYFYLPNMMFASFVVGTKRFNIVEKTTFCSIIVLDWIIYIIMHNGGDTLPYKSRILGIDGF